MWLGTDDLDIFCREAGIDETGGHGLSRFDRPIHALDRGDFDQLHEDVTGKLLVRPARVTVTFGDPVFPDDLEGEGRGATPEERISAALRDRVARLGGLAPRDTERGVTA